MSFAPPSRLSTLTVLVFLAVLVALPAQVLRYNFSKENGFVAIIDFGREFRPLALPEIRELTPPGASKWGYDGQFYAQVALRPALDDPALDRALDNAQYRARRIGLPFLAHLLGMGKPACVLQIYALLNAAFWAVLLAALLRFVGFRRFRDVLLAYALLGCAGTLASVERALPDLPATVLGTLAILSRQGSSIAGATLLSAAALIKDTSILSFAMQWGRRSSHALARLLILFLPIACWVAYVHLRLDAGAGLGHGNFAPPFVGLAEKLQLATGHLLSASSEISIFTRARLLFEIAGPLSLLLQAAYLAMHPRPGSAAWKFGIGFALLLCFVSEHVWGLEGNYTRVLLPLTFAFNLLLHAHESGRRYALWFAAGNVSLWSVLLQALEPR